MATPAVPEPDLDQLRRWIGREETAEDVVTADLARKFNATLDLPGQPPRAGEAAPRLIHFCLGQPAAPTAALGPDGHPERGGFLPPVPLPRRMWAGGSIAFDGELRVGDAVRRVSRITDVVAKQGRTGPLCFVTVEHVIEAGGRVAVRERQDLVYRGPDSGEKAPAPPAEPGRHRRRVEAGAPLLFRYSALTFNGHRIHYDRRHATEAEGYPGLVVHGPLQTTLLCHFAAAIHGAPPARFAFRSHSPLFDGDAIMLHAGEVGGGTLRLWTARDGGPVAMAVEAGWD
ncbi:HTD2 family dehydratase [Inquilinus limosus]|uniref:Metal-binding domain containing of MaoC dehydratase n=1 Tax=Inquilinus limosus MP06 TaxID=1398085 RepID=A0A0A0D5S2_9PROT|nr:MaoC family dehydratase N-terminal domain-containing protein [Inquilinus limosus]KGM33203.1 metal-binding domain containing of MaoC dehydratase [Inquilinus limosus MP06]